MQTPAFVIGSVVGKAGEPSPPAARCGCNFSQLGRVTANLAAIPPAHRWTELTRPIFPFPADPDLSMVSFLLSRTA